MTGESTLSLLSGYRKISLEDRFQYIYASINAFMILCVSSTLVYIAKILMMLCKKHFYDEYVSDMQ